MAASQTETAGAGKSTSPAAGRRAAPSTDIAARCLYRRRPCAWVEAKWKMFIAARKYAVVLAVIAGAGAIPAAVLRLISSAWDTPWDLADMWGALQWLSIGLLTLTIPVSVVWMIIAVARRQWDSLGPLVIAFWIPVLACVAGMMTNFKVLNSG